MNEELHLYIVLKSWRAVDRGADKLKDFRDQGSNPQSWQCLGNKSTLVKISEKLRFRLNVIKHFVPEVTENIFPEP